jgi:hypothetical protein
MLNWDRYRFHKNRAWTHYAKLVFVHPVGCVRHVVNSSASWSSNVDTLFSCSGGTSMDRTKSTLEQFMPNLCFCIQWDVRLTSFQCIRGAKHRHTIFGARVGPVRIQQKAHRDTAGQTFFYILWDLQVT